jgi:hypothetical protein
MGCDIHFYAERKVDGVWQQALMPDKESKFEQTRFYYNRNYLLFGLLAGVHNENVTPLVAPRGIPEDLSKALKDNWDSGASDYHTPSHFLLSELLTFKESKIANTGYVNVLNYKKFKKVGYPDTWRYDIWMGSNKACVDNARMERVMKMAAFLGDVEYFTEIAWEQPVKTIAPDFWEDALKRLQELDPNPENVRCVFWFDN